MCNTHGEESACNAGDMGSIPGSGRSRGGAHGNPFQNPCLKIPLTEEPGRLQSTGSQRVGYTWGTNSFTLFLHKMKEMAKAPFLMLRSMWVGGGPCEHIWHHPHLPILRTTPPYPGQRSPSLCRVRQPLPTIFPCQPCTLNLPLAEQPSDFLTALIKPLWFAAPSSRF